MMSGSSIAAPDYQDLAVPSEVAQARLADTSRNHFQSDGGCSLMNLPNTSAMPPPKRIAFHVDELVVVIHWRFSWSKFGANSISA